MDKAIQSIDRLISSLAPTLEVVTMPTTPYQDQLPGTSGLRKKVVRFQEKNYLENFIQAIFDCVNNVKGGTFVVSGDGRFFNKEASEVIIRMAAANGVRRLIVGVNYLMSTPCVSYVIRQRKADGGIILTASHNPGGPKEDFGVKFNCENGGPALEKTTDAIFQRSKTLQEFKITRDVAHIDASRPGTHQFGQLTVEVIDAPRAYTGLMQSIFDFKALHAFVNRKDFSLVYDSLHGVAGPFVKDIFHKQFGVPLDSLLNADPLPDFGGGHPDPNLTYAHDLVEAMGLGDHAPEHVPDFGAAADGDADRNMILGRRFFVTPSDSVAIIAANSHAIPYFKGGLKGVARSMPTSGALDFVAKKLGLTLYEVPTGWKYFGNLMDAGRLSVCGEESFGTGSDHIREKDGVWAVLAWLSILASRNPDPSKPLVTVEDIVVEHWKTYGRNYYTRYDYEGVESAGADQLMAHLRKLVSEFSSSKPSFDGNTISTADEFSYKDPVDGSVTTKQGIRFIFSDGSRIIFRLSGTGSVGATVRVYIEKYEPKDISGAAAESLAPLVKLALSLSKLAEFTGRNAPTVIT